MAESPEDTPTQDNTPPAPPADDPPADDNSAPPSADPTESPSPPEPEPEPEAPPHSPPPPEDPPPSPSPPEDPPPSPPQSPPPADVPPPKSSSSPPPPSADDSAPPPPSLPPPSPDSPVRPPPQPKPRGDPPPPPLKPFAPPTPPSGGLQPPPPRTPSKPSPPNRTPPDPATPSNKDHSDSTLPLVLGLTIGIGLLVIIMALVLCSKRKRKSPNNGMPYSDGPGPKGGYYNGGQLPKWQNGGPGMEYGGILPPPPGLWGQMPPPPGMGSGEMSLNNSGPHALAPPSPSVGLGFSKSSFTYDELAAATNGFSRENLLGQGGFGYVYKGVLLNGTVVAVKQLKSGSGQGEREFQAEVEIISRVHHRHLVSLVGYCIAGAQRMLVYEFVPNNTLEHHLHGRGQPTMVWPTRLKIAIGSAKGLAYLHEDCHPRIIHRDIKTANILLDNNFEAMVADFGLAKFTSDTNTHVSTRIMGTFGYLAPEYASTGKLTEKSDVFSFGVMLLELITGRRPVDNYMEESLVEWSRPLLTQAMNDEKYEELADPRLESRYDTAEMARMVASAAACVRHSAKRRPKMSQIVRALDGDVSLDDLNKSGQSTAFSAGSENDSYSEKMRQFRKLALESTDYSNEYSGGTSDYGLNPSEVSSSGEMSSAGSRTAAAPPYHKL